MPPKSSRASLKPESKVNGKKRSAPSPEPEAPLKRSRPSSSRSKPPSASAAPSSRKSVRGKASEEPENSSAGGSNGASGSKTANKEASKPKNKLLAGIKEEETKASSRRSVAGGSKRPAAPRLGRLPLPTAPDHPRPARTAMVFGTGDSGEFGMGDDERGEKNKPELQSWIETAIEEGTLGGEGAGIEALVCGGMHSLMVDEQGHVWSWGVNDGGALGRPTDKVPDPKNAGQTLDRDVLEATPGVVQALVDCNFRAVKVAAGDSVSMALSDEGRVKYWGSFRGKEGLMGFGGVDKKIQYEPVDLPWQSSRSESDRFIAIAAGADHIVALSADGFVFALGDGEKAQLGRKIMARRRLNSLHPERLALKNIVAIGAGSFHSFAINEDGEVYGWGNNAFGQLGVADEDIHPGWEKGVVEQPTKIRALSPTEHGGAKVKLITAGQNHSLFLFDNGALWSTGKLVNHEVGIGADHPALTEEAKEEQFIGQPVQVFFPPPSTPENKVPRVQPYEDTEEYRKASRRVAHAAAGSRHSIAVTTDGFYYSWGSGPAAQLGLGSKELAEVPTLLTNKLLRTHTGLEAATGAMTSFIIARPRAEEWGA